MKNIKEYLYFLVLKTYIIDQKNEILLDDNYKLTIITEEELDWKEEKDYYHLISDISFFVSISNQDETCEMFYKIKTHRSLKQLLQQSDMRKLKFITNRKLHNFNNYYRVKVKGKITSSSMKKAILKETSKQLQQISNINNKTMQKIKKI